MQQEWIMNLQKGLNRIFILLSLVVSLFGFVFGREYVSESWKPGSEEVFHSINWNEENIRKYHNLASTVSEEERTEIETDRARIEEEEERVKTKQKINAKNPFYTDTNKRDDDRKLLFLEIERNAFMIREQNYHVKIDDLPNYEKSPPQYNEYIFQKSFPEALKTPTYKIWIGGTMGVLIVFLPCYAGLHLIRDPLKRFYMMYSEMVYMILKALVFCVGVAFIMDSRRNYYEPLEFALGLAICIVSGVVLLKAIRNYLK